MMALAFSGGRDSMACLHLWRDKLDCAIHVDPGYGYPETRHLVNYASEILPVHVVLSDRRGQNEAHGLPSDVVPIDYTTLGQQITSPKPVKIQSYLQCCFENLMRPVWQKAHELGVTHLVFGQRDAEGYRAPAWDGMMVEGITRLHPIASWTTQQVLDYLTTKMEVPAHYYFPAQTSLDCYDCTAFGRESQERLAWTHQHHPAAYAAYEARHQALTSAIRAALLAAGYDEATAAHVNEPAESLSKKSSCGGGG